MQQWECIVCGWVYDEKVGDPDSGIAPGTKFEDIPDDWLCPECGVGKDDFELVDIPDTQPSASAPESTDNPVKPKATHSTDPIVIIGSGMAGYGLLKELRKLNPSQAITLICADDGRAYSKPALSTGYTKNTSGKDLTQATAVEMALDHGMNILTNTQAAKIDCANKVVMLGDDSGVVRYSKLVLATGANCIECRLEGNAIDEVYTINDLRGFEFFRARAEQLGAKKIAIIGAGLIGCEYANDLLNGGYQTISVDPLSSCLPTLIPETAGRAVQTALEEQGAEFRFGNRVVAVNSSENGLELTLDDGSVFAADMVLSAIGVVPNIKLAAASGLSTSRGIKTNEFLETSHTDVYALGDCAEVNGLNLVYVSPLVAGYKALAQTLSGQRTAVAYPAMPVSVKTPACPVTVCPPPHGSEGEWVTVKQDGQNVHMEYENPQGETFGFALTGDACKLARELTANLPNWLE